MTKQLKMLAALLLMTTATQARLPLKEVQEVQAWRADTLKTDTLKTDSIPADSVKVLKAKKKGKGDKEDEKKDEKKESEYEKLVKKGGTVLKGLFTVRHIEDTY